MTMSQAFGFGITADADPRQLTTQNVFTWLLLYLAYTILMLAPILGLLFSLGRRQLRLPRVKRWLALVSIISLAFLIPVVRHSWRAVYNLALPSRIMGRYIIFLPVLFLITAFLPLSVRPREPLTCRLSYLLRTILLPLALVVFSYFLLIRESIIPLKPGFISPFAAYDVYYMKLLGPWFWLFLVLLYAIPPFLARGAKPKIVRRLTALILVIFYMLALPKYFNVIRAAQYYERLGSRIVDLLREYGSEDGQALQVLLPDTIDSTSRADIGWAIRIHHFSADITVAGYAPDAWIEPTESPAIQVMPIEYADQVARDGRYERVFDNAFVVRMLLPERAYP